MIRAYTRRIFRQSQILLCINHRDLTGVLEGDTVYQNLAYRKVRHTHLMNYLNLEKLKRSEGSYLSEAYVDGIHSEITMYILSGAILTPINTILIFKVP